MAGSTGNGTCRSGSLRTHSRTAIRRAARGPSAAPYSVCVGRCAGGARRAARAVPRTSRARAFALVGPLVRTDSLEGRTGCAGCTARARRPWAAASRSVGSCCALCAPTPIPTRPWVACRDSAAHARTRTAEGRDRRLMCRCRALRARARGLGAGTYLSPAGRGHACGAVPAGSADAGEGFNSLTVGPLHGRCVGWYCTPCGCMARSPSSVCASAGGAEGGGAYECGRDDRHVCTWVDRAWRVARIRWLRYTAKCKPCRRRPDQAETDRCLHASQSEHLEAVEAQARRGMPRRKRPPPASRPLAIWTRTDAQKTCSRDCCATGARPASSWSDCARCGAVGPSKSWARRVVPDRNAMGRAQRPVTVSASYFRRWPGLQRHLALVHAHISRVGDVRVLSTRA